MPAPPPAPAPAPPPATPVRAIEPGQVQLQDETIDAGTVVLAAGIVPSAATPNEMARKAMSTSADLSFIPPIYARHQHDGSVPLDPRLVCE